MVVLIAAVLALAAPLGIGIGVADAAPSRVIGNIDGAQRLPDRGVRFVGHARDQSDVTATLQVVIQVRKPGEVEFKEIRGSRTPANTARADVARHGFDFVVRGIPVHSTMRAVAIGPDGRVVRLQFSTPGVQPDFVVEPVPPLSPQQSEELQRSSGLVASACRDGVQSTDCTDLYQKFFSDIPIVYYNDVASGAELGDTNTCEYEATQITIPRLC